KLFCFEQTALTDNGRVFGERNHWKRMIGYLSVKDKLQGSLTYDTWAVTLINYLLSTLSDEKRTEERRLLEGLRFDKLLTQLEDRVRRQSLASNEDSSLAPGGNESTNLMKQIEVYRHLADEDHRQGNIEEANLDATNPKDLFNRVHDQALKDGFINELTKILTNLVTLPPEAYVLFKQNIKHYYSFPISIYIYTYTHIYVIDFCGIDQ
ncbi:hypothetical protein RFI_01817, partial [Reticulomyxa filosa]